MKTYKGKYKLKNPSKYVGNPDKIVYRSGWELQMMKQFDTRDDILQWASEEIAIPYMSPVDKRMHRYYLDMIIKARQKDGSIQMFCVEIKPYAQTMAPKKTSRKTSRYLNEVKTYAVNEAKWIAAEAYCASKNWKFIILHEKNVKFI